MKNTLLQNLDKLHTTDLGIIRIQKNIQLATDVISWCKDKINSPFATITKRGKNFYIDIDNFIITVNSYSYTVITVHKVK
ncbi:MAG: DUF3781 domain-containing protein [Alphaproteobacteria bacterium]|nr:DUF3781 domain-containing protein [Alphaproteobacteria bacterium]